MSDTDTDERVIEVEPADTRSDVHKFYDLWTAHHARATGSIPLPRDLAWRRHTPVPCGHTAPWLVDEDAHDGKPYCSACGETVLVPPARTRSGHRHDAEPENRWIGFWRSLNPTGQAIAAGLGSLAGVGLFALLIDLLG